MFRRKINIRNPGSPVGAAVLSQGQYQLAWERQTMPDPGAQAYSWETLDIAQFNIVNSGYGYRQFWGLFGMPVRQGQVIRIAGLPTVGASLAPQPLILGY